MKSFFFKLAFFVLIGTGLFLGWAYLWGLYGFIDRDRFDLIIRILPPWQKQELANALNYYYENTAVSKYTAGQILSCEPESESIKRQFNWFHRSTPGAMMNTMPDYDVIVRESLAARIREDDIPPPGASTAKLELLLWKDCKQDKPALFTRKDAIGFSLGGGSLALRLAAASINPAVGLALTGVGLVQASLSDPAKAIPAILCLLDMRFRNFSWCFLGSWALSTVIFYRRKQGKSRN